MSKPKWIFVWSEHTEGYGSSRRTTQGWVMQNRPNQTPAQDGFLVAHDVFHHHPQDKGTYAQEVFSFGAQKYMEEDPPKDKSVSKIWSTGTNTKISSQPLSGRLQDAWFSVMANTVDMGTRGLRGLMLPPQLTVPPRDIDPNILLDWQQIYTAAIRELQLDFYVREEQEVWDVLLSDRMTLRAALHAHTGWIWASHAFPDRAQMRAQFDAVAKASEKKAELGTQLVVEQHTDGTISIATLPPVLIPQSTHTVPLARVKR